VRVEIIRSIENNRPYIARRDTWSLTAVLEPFTNAQQTSEHGTSHDRP
jgi:hypothetical protein